MGKEITKAEIEKVIKTLTSRDSKDYLASCVLLASAYVGPSVANISKLLKVSPSKIEPIARRYRFNKIWVKDKVTGGEWFKKETSGVSFCLDVACGMGWLKRRFKNKKTSDKT